MDVGVDFGERFGELAVDGHPFAGFEVVMLEEKHEEGGA
jgi:hypothetical protein